jgi:hypothetical protein
VAQPVAKSVVAISPSKISWIRRMDGDYFNQLCGAISIKENRGAGSLRPGANNDEKP